jgi:hypothetical protein
LDWAILQAYRIDGAMNKTAKKWSKRRMKKMKRAEKEKDLLTEEDAEEADNTGVFPDESTVLDFFLFIFFLFVNNADAIYKLNRLKM